jgi:hypothetical protein
VAGRAVVQLIGSGLLMELDRARELYCDLQRARGWWIDAEKISQQRLTGTTPGDAARREDAILDLAVIRIEFLFQRRADAEKDALAAAEMFSEPWQRDLAKACVRAAAGAPGELPEPPAGSAPRWKLLRDVASGKGDAAALAKSCGDAEPELRRWLAARLASSSDDVRALELRRRAAPASFDPKTLVQREDEALLFVEPLGGSTSVVLLRKGRITRVEAAGDAGLAAFWDACWVDPRQLDAAAKRVSAALFDPRITADLAGAKRLWVSVAEPLGPLPFDLLPYGDAQLIDAFEVETVSSLSEFAESRARRDPPMLTMLSSPHASLDARHAVVVTAPFPAAARTRIFQLLGASQNQGLDAGGALRKAKLALRDEWKPDAKSPPSVPAWAALLLRGAP